jgi:hypothetical protein
MEDLDEMLRNLRVKVLWFDQKNARIAAELMAERNNRLCNICGNLDWADTIVASYYNMGDFIITNNGGDFPTSGGFENKILTTDQIMNVR